MLRTLAPHQTPRQPQKTDILTEKRTVSKQIGTEWRIGAKLLGYLAAALLLSALLRAAAIRAGLELSGSLVDLIEYNSLFYGAS